MSKFSSDEFLSLSYLPGADFERFALNIIECEAEARHKHILKGVDAASLLKNKFDSKDEHKYAFDAVAPLGITDSLFTVVEVKKTSKQIDEAVNQIKQLISRYTNIVGLSRKYKLLIVISSGRRVTERLLEIKESFSIEIWSIEDLVEKAKLYPFEYNAFLELAISKTTNKSLIGAIKDESEFVSDADFEAQNDRLIKALNNYISENKISLVLGTGVSMDYNDKLSWDALAGRLYDSLDEGKKFTDRDNAFLILGGNNVSSVQYSKYNLGNKYSAALYKLIYPKKNAYLVGDKSLDECANMINQSKNGKRLVGKVITYNYDDYLEQALNARQTAYHVLCRDSDYLKGDIPIYHVHGYLPENSNYAERKEFIKTVILSEEDYFKCYGDSSNWNVAIQLESFKDDVCLFVGNSISDFNERRLLNKTKQEKGKSHFAIIYTKGLDYSDLAKIYMHFFYELNVKIIWAKSIDAIPAIIRDIYHISKLNNF